MAFRMKVNTSLIRIACLLGLLFIAMTAHAQSDNFIRVNEEKTIDFGDSIGEIHFFAGEVFREMGDNPQGKYIDYRGETLLLRYGSVGNIQPGTINYTKLYESDTAANQRIVNRMADLKEAIKQSLKVRKPASPDQGMLVVDLQPLDSRFDDQIKVQIANDATVRFTNDSIRQGQVTLNKLQFPLRIIPEGFPTFWLAESDLSEANPPVAEDMPAARQEETLDEQPADTSEANTASPGWLLWVIALLALLAAVFAALVFTKKQKSSDNETLVSTQKEILKRLTSLEAGSVPASAAPDPGISEKKLKKLEEENNRLQKELSTLKEGKARQESELAAATGHLSDSGRKALLFKEDAKAFAEHRMEIISQGLALYHSLLHLASVSTTDPETLREQSILASIILDNELLEQVNKVRVYGVELDRLATSGVWTDPAHVRKLKDETNENKKLAYIDKDRFKAILGPFLNRLAVALEEVRNLAEISGTSSGLSKQAASIGEKAHDLRKSARQLLGVEMDYVPLFVAVSEYPHVTAVPGQPLDRYAGVDVAKNHILQIKDYGIVYKDSKSGTEVILKR
ncbi:hypothetical protein AB9P05_00295 [Roseivirga sp. BDSF3-8]|uniref:hypothetical protein n=1 Tax=Roseivirga sp. BDSF3-8 TaxID=3241598 RepID=UPI0035326396